MALDLRSALEQCTEWATLARAYPQRYSVRFWVRVPDPATDPADIGGGKLVVKLDATDRVTALSCSLI